MGRLCERPGCSDVAAMAYGFDVDRLLVWLAPREPDGDPLRAGSLCKRHADAMVVPRGWTLDDRREADAAPVPPDGRRDAAARRRGRAQAPAAGRAAAPTQLALARRAERDRRRGHRRAARRRRSRRHGGHPVDARRSTSSDDLDGVLAARSPLLARAFRGTDRPR